MRLIERISKGMQGIAFGLIEGIIMILGLSLGVSGLSNSALFVFVVGFTGAIADAFANFSGLWVSEEIESEHKISSHSKEEILFAAVLAFFSTLVSAVIPIIPYLFLDIPSARIYSVIIGLILLFAFGVFHATKSHENGLIEGTKFALLGLFTSIICFYIGSVLPGLILP